MSFCIFITRLDSFFSFLIGLRVTVLGIYTGVYGTKRHEYLFIFHYLYTHIVIYTYIHWRPGVAASIIFLYFCNVYSRFSNHGLVIHNYVALYFLSITM